MMMDNKDTEGDGNGLSDMNIANHSILFLAAGSETVSDSMGFYFINMCKNPKYYALVAKELDECTLNENGLLDHAQLKGLKWLDATIQETLRMDTVIGGPLFRVALEDCVVDGVNVPKGTNVVTSMMYVNSHHSGWNDPETFRPERFLNAVDGSKSEALALADSTARANFYTPFGIGARNCIGQSFAIIEMKLFLGNLLKRYALKDIEGQSIEKSLHVTLQINTGSYNVKLSRK